MRYRWSEQHKAYTLHLDRDVPPAWIFAGPERATEVGTALFWELARMEAMGSATPRPYCRDAICVRLRADNYPAREIDPAERDAILASVVEVVRRHLAPDETAEPFEEPSTDGPAGAVPAGEKHQGS